MVAGPGPRVARAVQTGGGARDTQEQGRPRVLAVPEERSSDGVTLSSSEVTCRRAKRLRGQSPWGGGGVMAPLGAARAEGRGGGGRVWISRKGCVWERWGSSEAAGGSRETPVSGLGATRPRGSHVPPAPRLAVEGRPRAVHVGAGGWKWEGKEASWGIPSRHRVSFPGGGGVPRDADRSPEPGTKGGQRGRGAAAENTSVVCTCAWDVPEDVAETPLPGEPRRETRLEARTAKRGDGGRIERGVKARVGAGRCGCQAGFTFSSLTAIHCFCPSNTRGARGRPSLQPGPRALLAQPSGGFSPLAFLSLHRRLNVASRSDVDPELQTHEPPACGPSTWPFNSGFLFPPDPSPLQSPPPENGPLWCLSPSLGACSTSLFVHTLLHLSQKIAIWAHLLLPSTHALSS